MKPYSYSSFLAKKGGQKGALQRMAKSYPDEYKLVCKMRETYKTLFDLKANQFESLLVQALRELVNDGICKKPRF
jgi:hypothetical protein